MTSCESDVRNGGRELKKANQKLMEQLTTVSFRSRAELEAMTLEQLRARMNAINTTLKQLRRMRKRGYVNPPVEAAIRKEKKLMKNVMKAKRQAARLSTQKEG